MVYFVQMQTVPYLIKIGTTEEDNLALRLNALKSECNNEIVLLMTLKGNFTEERRLHAKFHDICVGGEWFFPSRQLLKFIFDRVSSDKLQLVKKNNFQGLIKFNSSLENDHNNIVKEIKTESRNLEKENEVLYEESKRLLSENIKLEAELRKYKLETEDT